MNGIEIKLTNHFKDLSIIFSSDLFWTHHFQQIITKAYQKLGLISRTFSALILAIPKNSTYHSSSLNSLIALNFGEKQVQR